MKNFTLALAIALVASAGPSRSSAQAINVNDSLALVDLYNSTGGPNWVNHTNWLTSKPVYTWFGITSQDSIRVNIVTLNNNNLIGILSSSIGNLTALYFLDLSFNRLSGSIPSSVLNYSYCGINLAHNQLSGTIPLFPFNSITPLDLTYNNYTFSMLEPILIASQTSPIGILYDSIQSDLPLIQNGNTLSIAAGGTVTNNTYTWYKDGTLVATKTGDSTYLSTGAGSYGVAVTNSQVPRLTLYSIQNVNTQDSLSLIDLYNSTNGPGWVNNTNWATTAPVATWYGVTPRLGRVTQLNLQGNNLSGPIPTSIGNLTSVNILNFYINQLSGSIPTTVDNLQLLTNLKLNSNRLTGSIPASFGNLPNLNFLYLSGNLLSGSIPSSLGNMTNLSWLELEGNQLSGSIPQELGNLKNISFIDLGKNQLSDTIPSSIGNCTALFEFDANNNQLTGHIPAAFGRAQNLANLDLNSNHLTGIIPDSLCYMPQLAHLYLYDNELTGTLPDSLGNDPQILNVQVQNNNLSGTIKADFTKLNFFAINVSGNKYTYSTFPLLLPTLNTYIYAPQQPVPLTRVESTLSVSTGGNSANTTYTLFKDGASVATQAGDSAFTIASLGNYNIVTTNPAAPKLTIYSDTLRLGLVLPDSSISMTQTITGTTTTDINTTIFRLVAITPSTGPGALSGDVTAMVTIDPSPQTYNGLPYVTRHYDITPATNPTTSQATITLYFTQQDFDTYNTYVTANNLNLPLLPTNGVDNGNVVITQYHGAFTGTSSPANYSQGYEIITPTVTWDAIDGWWTVTFPVSGFSGFFLSSGSTPLPLTLLQFTGAPQGYTVDLQWKTTDEENTGQFIVQRSTDGVSFNPIGTVPAKNTIGEQTYGFTDNNPQTGNNYYRLKMQDLDGRFTYSPIVRIAIAALPADCQAYPNPATGRTSLLFNSEKVATYTIRITDAGGKLMTLLAGTATIGLNKIDISLQGYAPGSYVITLDDEQHGRRSIQLIKE
jgi:Leucine-rich repeat (LRR) protein